MKIFFTFQEAKALVKTARIRSARQYRKNRPNNLPFAPHLYYKEWVSWQDFFGKPGNIEFPSFEEACRLVRKAKITNCHNYRNNRPKNLPAAPDQYYKDNGWKNWKYFFKTEWLPYDKARKIARSMKVGSAEEYREKVRFGEFDNIPVAPDKFYKNKGWTNWYDFLNLKSKSK